MNEINPKQQKQRGILRIAGPIVLTVGLVFIVIGMISFFSAFSSSGSPKYFWCAFVGMPLAFVGMVLCKFAFIGSVARYAAGEVAPVGKDTFNYMAKETQPGVRIIAQAVVQGAQSGLADEGTVEERLRKLEALKQGGLITDDEFEAQKTRILSEI